ncbi:MAG: STAS domain-containing protein [Marinilabiliaceae bacterium]|nr:STAS domain-containing protein [Marinilabiliaceae bacterium]
MPKAYNVNTNEDKSLLNIMGFEVSKKDGYAIIRTNESNLDAHTVPQLNSELVILSGQQTKNMILDLTECDYCDAAGLSALMIAHRLCKEGKLILCGLTPGVERMISIQRFDPPLIIVADLVEAESRMEK